jgi:hypothetical protein
VLSDTFYVLGGQLKPKIFHENCLMIERIGLRNCMQNKFESIEIALPTALNHVPSLTEMGLYVPSDYECIIFGGYSVQEDKSKELCFKFSACHGNPESIEQLLCSQGKPVNLAKPDFFSGNDALHSFSDRLIFFGQQGLHQMDSQ